MRRIAGDDSDRRAQRRCFGRSSTPAGTILMATTGVVLLVVFLVFVVLAPNFLSLHVPSNILTFAASYGFVVVIAFLSYLLMRTRHGNRTFAVGGL
jgi:ABC-type xylose transport system permease subunit